MRFAKDDQGVAAVVGFVLILAAAITYYSYVARNEVPRWGAQAEQEAAAKSENCTRAQESLRTLESGQRIARTDAKGERYYLEDAQIAQETARARQIVKDSCG